MQLPNSVQEVAEVIGTERALFLIGKLPRYYKKGNGSTLYLYVPTLARMGMDHELVKIMGWNDAQKLARAFAGEILQLASCASIYREFRDQNIMRMAGDGIPVKMLATWFNVSERHIKNLMREIPHEEKPQEKQQTSATNNREKRRANESIKTLVSA